MAPWSVLPARTIQRWWPKYSRGKISCFAQNKYSPSKCTGTQSRAAYRAYWRHGTSLPTASSLWTTARWNWPRLRLPTQALNAFCFPRTTIAASLAMLRRLRDTCGKERVSSDDALRLESIRQGAAFRVQAAAAATPESFLAQAEAVVTFDFGCAAEPRVLELVNKTNQFNLNGRRYTEADWRNLTSQPDAVVLSVSYEDKFGPLGTIAVVAGAVPRKTSGRSKPGL